MNLKQKLGDFVKLEDAQGNVAKLAGLGTVVATSVLVSAMPAVASGPVPHCDCYSNYTDYSDCYANGRPCPI